MTLVLATKSQQSVLTSGVAEVLLRKELFKRSAVATASGKATIILPGIVVASSPRYNVMESLKIYSDSATTPVITLYEDDALPQNFIGGSDEGGLNEWSEDPPLYTQSPIVIQWTGADVGSNCFVRVQYSQIEHVSVRI